MDATMDMRPLASATARYRYIRNLMPETPHLHRSALPRQPPDDEGHPRACKAAGQAPAEQWQMVVEEQARARSFTTPQATRTR